MKSGDDFGVKWDINFKMEAKMKKIAMLVLAVSVAN